MSATPAFVSTPKTTPISILPADTTTKKTVATAGASGTKVVGLIVTSTDTAARVVQLFLTRSATNYLLGAWTIPALAGSDGSAGTQDLLNIFSGLPRDADGQRYFYLESGDTLTVATTTTVTAAKEIDVFALFGNF
jgi:hypothetical protein